MAISAEMYISFQKIIMFAQEKKLELLRGGRGVEEPILSDEPQLEDMQPQELDHRAAPKLVHTDEGLPSPSSAPALPSPSSITDLLKTDSDDKQLSLEEVLHKIEKTEETQQKAPPKPDEKKADVPSPHAEQPAKDAPADEDNDDMSDQPYSLRQRFKDWREARQKWHIEKWRKDYEYACKKQQIKDMCVGYDEIIAYVKQLMSDWDDIAAEDNIADAPNVTISGVHDGLGA